jgi:hypothetical protein
VDSVRNLMDGDRREEYRDFVNRYEVGTPPYGDIPDEEALSRYHEMTSELSEEDYQRSARETFSRMAPEERVEFGRQLRDQSDQWGLGLPGRSAEDRFEEPELLARVTARAHRDHPDLLESLLKSGGTGLVGGATGDGMTGGEGASGGGGMASNPAAKTVITGIAAVTAKRAGDG